ncbi:MAG TPA: rod shape-determining protein MreD [Nevskiaceae bacterium]|nr:rod shape-determining protein MreD [Nevskiaceae bacterium]
MTRVPYGRFWLSLAVAFLFQLVEVPDAIAAARPLWVPLILLYWALVEPRMPVFFAAFFSGIALDVVLNSALGQHAAGFVVLTWFMARLRGVFILFPLWQLTIALVPAWVGYCFLMSTIDDFSRHRADPMLRWLPAFSTTLFWPLVYAVMESLGRKSSAEE